MDKENSSPTKMAAKFVLSSSSSTNKLFQLQYSCSSLLPLPLSLPTISPKRRVNSFKIHAKLGTAKHRVSFMKHHNLKSSRNMIVWLYF